MNKWSINELLTLNFIKGITYRHIKDITRNYSNLEELQNSKIPTYLQKFFQQESFFNNTISIAQSKALTQIDICEKKNINLISIFDSRYPDLLKEISNPPALLFVKGTLQESNAVSLAIVGTRKSSNYGKLATDHFASFFAKNNIIVCSGLANGIDTYAHLAATKSGGISYAVIAMRLDSITPQLTSKNADKIIDSGGAIISEYPMGTLAINPYFIQRNRIISGISKATIIVESSAKGGSLWTAKFAIDQNRDLFAIPGNINSEKSIGTNNLIRKEMAKIAISPEQVLEELGYSSEQMTTSNQKKHSFSNSDEENIYNVINMEPIHIDMIFDKTQIDISTILISLLNLEFNGLIRQLAGKYYIRG